MPRTTGGVKSRRRKNKILKMAKGYYGARSKLYRTATEAVDKALCYSYRDRKQRKREFRRLWIIRISAAAKIGDLTYSKFMHALKELGCALDRKSLAEMAVNDSDGFAKLLAKAKEVSVRLDKQFLPKAV